MRHPNEGRRVGPFTARSKVWIVNADDQVVLGPGRYRMLDAIQRLGSLQAAARELKMGYKALWARLTATERRLGIVLLHKDRTGSRLTPEAEDLMRRYQRLNRLVSAECDEGFDIVIRSQLRGEPDEEV